MASNSLMGRAIAERRRTTIGLATGVAALTGWVVSIYPLLRDSQAFADFLDSFPPAMASLFGLDPDTYLTGAGYLSSQVLSLLAPLMIIGFAVEGAVQATARDEQDDAMDMLLSMPLTRRTVILKCFSATAGLTFAVCAVLALTLLVANPLVDLGLSVAGIAAACGALWLLGMVFGSLALATSAFTGQPGSGRGIALAIAFVFWIITGFAPLYDWLSGPAALSPFTWYEHNTPLLDGFSSGHIWLGVAGLAMTALAVRLFDRRDIGTERAVLPRVTLRWRPRTTRTSQVRSAYLLTSVFNKTLWDRRSSIWAWIGAIGFILLVTFSAWPSFSKDAASLEQLISSLPPEIFALFGTADPSSLAQAPGFISSRAFQSIGPILVAVLGISSVRTLIASEESNGQFDLVVSHPVTRRRVLRDKAKGIFALHAVLAISLTVVTIVGNAAVGTGLEVTNMIAANVGLALLGIAFTGLTLAAWSFTSASGTSMRWVSGVAGVMWFLNGLGSIVDVLAPFRPLSLFYWYLGDVAPLGKGFELGYLPLLAVGVVGTAIAILRIDRRDLAI